MNLVVVPTGTANIASIFAGLRRLGVDPRMVRGAEDVDTADGVILPGVGSFGAAMGELDRRGLREAIAGRIRSGLPTLAVCVGMQLLASSSDESDDTIGLGVIDDRVTRFSDDVRVPQLGWNEVAAPSGARYVTDGWAYFANSFRFDSVPDGWMAATTDHGGEFVSALERGGVLACQFHPELSGAWGSEVLRRWLGRDG